MGLSDIMMEHDELHVKALFEGWRQAVAEDYHQKELIHLHKP